MANEGLEKSEETEHMIEKEPSKERGSGLGDAKEIRAVILAAFGGLNKLRVARKAMPEPQEGELKIRVKACGLNFIDLMVRQGNIDNPPKTPLVPGFECSGIVEGLGDGAKGFEIGDRVMAFVNYSAWGEVVCTPLEFVYKIPNDMGFAEAAAFPMNFVTAYMMLFEVANLRQGMSVLVHSAGGGVVITFQNCLFVCKGLRSLKEIYSLPPCFLHSNNIIRNEHVVYMVPWRVIPWRNRFLTQRTPDNWCIYLLASFDCSNECHIPSSLYATKFIVKYWFDCSKNKTFIFLCNLLLLQPLFMDCILQLNTEQAISCNVVKVNAQLHNILVNLCCNLTSVITTTYGRQNCTQYSTYGLTTFCPTWWQVEKVNPIKLYEENKVIAGFSLLNLLFKQNRAAKVKAVMDQLISLYNQKKIRPLVDSLWALEEVKEAMQRIHDRGNIGKLILDVEKTPTPLMASDSTETSEAGEEEEDHEGDNGNKERMPFIQ
ncbi:synaptic vesicle membrane protein VAT-1 homolog-like [Narcine bancroftii]|uniref:synaptic vesicle membrane protein VAT-1 homolog-like n=1 Tax=Narcine bancroftii TaxID=1343680 RepID=UPI0038321873